MKLITQVVFPLNNYEYICFPFQAALESLKMGDHIDVYLFQKHRQPYKLYDKHQVIWEAVRDLKMQLESVLAGTCEMRPDWKDRIGYLWNEYSRSRSAAPELGIKDPGTSWWEGNKYALWNYGSEPVTLLYSKNGEIILEVVPRYSNKKRSIPYKVFIRNYTSYIVRIISRETAEMWLKTITQVADIMLAHQEAYSKSIPYEPGELELLEKMRRDEFP